MESIKERLINLYGVNSKHSNYQVLASNYKGLISTEDLEIVSRYEKERWQYILSKLDIAGKMVLDIGANTGYFTFEAVNAGAKHVDYYEGNGRHAEFVDTSVEYFKMRQQVSVYNKYYMFDQEAETTYDVTFLMNVLHHLGDDYGNAEINIAEAKDNIIQQLNFMAKNTKRLVFQLGYNWKGNRNMCLFKNGTKEELINYITEGIEGYWKISDIGIATGFNKQKVSYEEPNEINLRRIDELGEFLNRPLFIMESLLL